MISNIHVGTSGWSYPHWKEIFYPSRVKPTHYLHYYAQHFNISEINTSFYHLPKPATIKGWLQKVPPDFIFCPKISRYLTHIKRLMGVEEPLERFFEVFSLMKERMGPVLIQLPPSLPFNNYERVEHFYSVLKQYYSEYSFVMEVRHTSWLSEPSLTLLSKYDIGFVVSQSGEHFPYAEAVTARNIYVRFHGPEALYASPYTDVMLEYFAQKFLAWQQEGHVVWAFFNNDINGHAFADAKRLMQQLKH